MIGGGGVREDEREREGKDEARFASECF